MSSSTWDWTDVLSRPANASPPPPVTSPPSEPLASAPSPTSASAPPSNLPTAAPTPPPAASVVPQLSTDTPSAPPKKSIFDFVSPFDAFDKPRSVSKASSPAPLQVKKEKLVRVDATTTNGISPIVKPATPAKQTAPPPLKPASHVVFQALEGQERQSSASSATSFSGLQKTDMGPAWLTRNVVDQGVEGKGPKRLTAHTVIDLSKPNVDSLVNAPGAVRVEPTTIMKASHVGFAPGRSMGMTANWVAYALKDGTLDRNRVS